MGKIYRVSSSLHEGHGDRGKETRSEDAVDGWYDCSYSHVGTTNVVRPLRQRTLER